LIGRRYRRVVVGECSGRAATGSTMVGAFALAMNVTAKGTASGSMTYNVAGCTSNGAV
jgi:hypothetical protein